ncbi:hypothetical protein JVT61DRAFT_3429 [Boletus reticuloceps]|uniref:Translation initiation factor beta propellor-like domain-containing protein n=1 Tax=Boletus reticuloceps TaxID=495285 RepID=A0A8I3AA00_9AGAM|nr:hypothetical protein JVT61DRAFT_3429 [Boletus reticuloceps]
MWRVEDGKQMATMSTGSGDCCCLTVSNDGKWIAAGTWSDGDALSVWDAKTYERVFKDEDICFICAVDFSPDSKRLVMASYHGEVIVWDVASNKQVQMVHHQFVRVAKYSPTGDHIATATASSVKVWDSNDGRLLVSINVKVTAYNAGLVWFNNHLLVVSNNTIKQFDTATGSAVAKWPVLGSDDSCIALPKHGKFIAHSTKNTITFWDTSTHAQVSLIQHPQDIKSIAFSPDDQSLAFGGKDGKISIIRVSRIIVSVVSLD